jgi:hypothetical protein
MIVVALQKLSLNRRFNLPFLETVRHRVVSIPSMAFRGHSLEISQKFSRMADEDCEKGGFDRRRRKLRMWEGLDGMPRHGRAWHGMGGGKRVRAAGEEKGRGGGKWNLGSMGEMVSAIPFLGLLVGRGTGGKSAIATAKSQLSRLSRDFVWCDAVRCLSIVFDQSPHPILPVIESGNQHRRCC